MQMAIYPRETSSVLLQAYGICKQKSQVMPICFGIIVVSHLQNRGAQINTKFSSDNNEIICVNVRNAYAHEKKFTKKQIKFQFQYGLGIGDEHFVQNPIFAK